MSISSAYHMVKSCEDYHGISSSSMFFHIARIKWAMLQHKCPDLPYETNVARREFVKRVATGNVESRQISKTPWLEPVVAGILKDLRCSS